MNEKTLEDYLGAIFVIKERSMDEKDGIRAVDIAKQLKISKASVSEMVAKLSRLGYIKSEKYSKIHFTKKGFEKAQKITHNHRLIEYFLRQVLKIDIEKIHKEAHLLEHAFSEETIKKLDDFLGNPVENPYGEIIPHKDD